MLLSLNYVALFICDNHSEQFAWLLQAVLFMEYTWMSVIICNVLLWLILKRTIYTLMSLAKQLCSGVSVTD